MNPIIQTHIRDALKVQAKTIHYETHGISSKEQIELEAMMEILRSRADLIRDLGVSLEDLRKAEADAGIEDRFCAFC